LFGAQLVAIPYLCLGAGILLEVILCVELNVQMSTSNALDYCIEVEASTLAGWESGLQSKMGTQGMEEGVQAED
jgi:hypothetical protein